MSIFPSSFHKFSAFSTKNTSKLFNKLILRFIWKSTRARIVNKILKKKKIGELKLPNFNFLYIFAECVFDRRFISKMYKEFLKPNTKKTNNQFKKGAKDLSRHLIKGGIQIANRHVKEFLLS